MTSTAASFRIRSRWRGRAHGLHGSAGAQPAGRTWASGGGRSCFETRSVQNYRPGPPRKRRCWMRTGAGDLHSTAPARSRDHVMAGFLGAIATVVLFALGRLHNDLGRGAGRHRSRRLRGIFLRSEVFARRWQLTDRRLIGPQGRVVNLLDQGSRPPVGMYRSSPRWCQASDEASGRPAGGDRHDHRCAAVRRATVAAMTGPQITATAQGILDQTPGDPVAGPPRGSRPLDTARLPELLIGLVFNSPAVAPGMRGVAQIRGLRWALDCRFGHWPVASGATHAAGRAGSPPPLLYADRPARLCRHRRAGAGRRLNYTRSPPTR